MQETGSSETRISQSAWSRLQQETPEWKWDGTWGWEWVMASDA